MRSAAQLITAIREHTDNDEFTQTAGTGAFTEGLSDDLFLEYLNDAQEYLQSRIIAEFAQTFIAEEEISLTADTELYTITGFPFMSNKVLNVEYSQDGNARNYRDLPKRTWEDRDTSKSNIPEFYIRGKGGILVNPIPRTTRGKIRVTYYEALPKMALRAGILDTYTEASSAISAISIDVTGVFTDPIDAEEFLTIVTKRGVVLEAAIGYSAYNSTTGDFTLSPTRS